MRLKGLRQQRKPPGPVVLRGSEIIVVCRILALKRSSTIGHSGSSLALAVTAVVKMPRHPYVPRTNLTGTFIDDSGISRWRFFRHPPAPDKPI